MEQSLMHTIHRVIVMSIDKRHGGLFGQCNDSKTTEECARHPLQPAHRKSKLLEGTPSSGNDEGVGEPRH